MKKTTTTLASFACLHSASAIISLTNPSFELDLVPENDTIAQVPTGWYKETGTTFDTFIFNSASGFSVWPGAVDGTHYWDIGNQTSPGYSTDFTVTTAGSYEFDWWENTASSVVTSADYIVTIKDSLDLTIVTGNFSAQNNFVWDNVSLVATFSTPGEYTLTFRPNDVFSGNDALIDHISVNAIPEPKTTVLSISALALAAALFRRRRK